MMDQYCAEMYNTTGHDEQKEKIAQAEAFAKLAADNGIDLNELTDPQVAELWDATFSEEEEDKTASAGSAADVEDLYKQANEEFSGYASQTEMQKQADAFGRQAAHAFYQELDEIEKAAEGAGRLSRLGDYVRRAGQSISETAGKAGKTVSEAAGKAGKAIGEESGVSDIARGVSGIRGREAMRAASNTGKTMKKRSIGDVVRTHKPALKSIASGAGKAARTTAAAGGVGGAGYLGVKAMKERDKSASALDQLAGELAFQKAAEDGWDQEEAAERLNAVLTLGAGESEKVAFANDTDEAIEIRSYELLDLAGYPVSWE